MNPLRLSTCALVLLVLCSLATLSESQGRDRSPGGFLRRLRPMKTRRLEAEETEARRACFVLSGLFQRRGCVVEVNAICRMYAFLIKNSDYDCEQFPCNGYGSDSRSVCVATGTCSRLTLSNGLCTADSECCIQSSDDS